MKKIKKVLIDCVDESIRTLVKDSIGKLENSLENVLGGYENIYVVGWGKASDEIIQHLIKLCPSKKLKKAVYLSPKKTVLKKKVWRLESDHPIPTERNIKHTKILKETILEAEQNDLIIFVSTGGGSAMLELPVQGVDLDVLQEINQLLLQNKVDARVINAVRRKLSLVKGGALLDGVRTQNILTIIVSDDVISRGTKNCLPHVASGPTYRGLYAIDASLFSKVPFFSTLSDNIQTVLKSERKKIKKTISEESLVLSDNLDLLNIIKKQLRKNFSNVHIAKEVFFGDCEKESERIVKDIVQLKKRYDPPFIYLAGGEVTTKKTGKGKGGRCQELVLRMIQNGFFQKNKGVVLCVDSDGEDYIGGVAGASVDDADYRKTSKIEIEEYLTHSDSYHLHKKLNTLVQKLPKLTNVGDVLVVLVA